MAREMTKQARGPTLRITPGKAGAQTINKHCVVVGRLEELDRNVVIQACVILLCLRSLVRQHQVAFLHQRREPIAHEPPETLDRKDFVVAIGSPLGIQSSVLALEGSLFLVEINAICIPVVEGCSREATGSFESNNSSSRARDATRVDS